MYRTEGQKQINETCAEYMHKTIFEKQSHDVFWSEENPGGNRTISSFLKVRDVTEAVVYGVVLEICVKAAVMGLLKRGIKTYLVRDATIHLNEEKGKKALDEMVEAGLILTDTKSVIEE